jgi:hypothetical protein
MPILEKAKAGDEIHDLIERVMHDHHAGLEGHKVTIGVKWVRPKTKADAFGPLRLHGYPCAAVIKITPYEQRVEGIEDAVIKIDQRRWKGMALSAREALIDHELTHLTLVRNRKTDEVLEDDLGRPRLRMKLHDVELGVFDSIIRRHGETSLDYQHVAAVMARYRQEVFAFADDMAPQDEAPSDVAESLGNGKGRGRKARKVEQGAAEEA